MSFIFKHPRYYKELRKLRNKLDQAISDSPESRVRDSVRPDPGPKHQASSVKPQAPEETRKLSKGASLGKRVSAFGEAPL